MIKRVEALDGDSCWNRAKSEEMLFVLLGRDMAAPVAIRAWVRERVRLRKNQWTDPQISEALACAEEMERDTPKGTPEIVTVDLTVRYTMHVMPTPGETLDEAVKVRRGMVWQAVQQFSNYLAVSNVNRNPGQLHLALVEARDDTGETLL